MYTGSRSAQQSGATTKRSDHLKSMLGAMVLAAFQMTNASVGCIVQVNSTSAADLAFYRDATRKQFECVGVACM
jgi:hypothetical protein